MLEKDRFPWLEQYVWFMVDIEGKMRKFIRGAAKIIFSRMLIIFLMILIQIFVLLMGFMRFGTYMHFISEGISILSAVLIVYIINKDEPTEFKLTWIIIICVLPVLGALIYLFVACNVGGIGIKEKYKKCIRESKALLYTSDKTKEALQKYPASFRGFVHYLGNKEGYPAYHNSSVVYYPKGENKFEALLEELKKAERYIFLEYFILYKGVMWDAILEVLKQKVKEGVEIRVMYDGMCAILELPYRYPKELKRYGIKAKMFSPIMPFLSTNQNNRDHRKIVVIDGKVAFTGGVNLADEYINAKVLYGHWKDVAVKITGDAVRSFVIMFLQMWGMSESKREDYEKYLSDITQEEIENAGIVIPYGETPTDTRETAKNVYQSIFQSATEYVHVMSPYFIVEREFLDHMRHAADRGVEVVMILPHIPDKRIVYYIARTFYPELLDAGIKVYEYKPGFIHAKAFVSDDICATVGTINLDYRSFYHHFECGAYFYDNMVVRAVEEDFQNTLKECIMVTKEYYKKIPLWQKCIGKTLKFFAPLL